LFLGDKRKDKGTAKKVKKEGFCKLFKERKEKSEKECRHGLESVGTVVPRVKNCPENGVFRNPGRVLESDD